MAGQMASLFKQCCQRVHFVWDHLRMIHITKELHSVESSMEHLHEVCGQQFGNCWLWTVRTWHLTCCYDSHTLAHVYVYRWLGMLCRTVTIVQSKGFRNMSVFQSEVGQCKWWYVTLIILEDHRCLVQKFKSGQTRTQWAFISNIFI